MTDFPGEGTVPVTALPADIGADGAATLLDVRDPHEWDLGHAPQAVHIPLTELPTRFDELFDTDVYVICRGGGRSEKAVRYLETVGIDAVVVDGGMLEWAAGGLPVVRADGTPGAL